MDWRLAVSRSCTCERAINAHCTLVSSDHRPRRQRLINAAAQALFEHCFLLSTDQTTTQTTNRTASRLATCAEGASCKLLHDAALYVDSEEQLDAHLAGRRVALNAVIIRYVSLACTSFAYCASSLKNSDLITLQITPNKINVTKHQ